MKDLLIVDLEATCFPRGEEPAGFVSEIIEIGAVVFDIAARRISRELQAFVRPALFPALSRYCVQLTGIQQADVDAGPPLDMALSRLVALYTPTDTVVTVQTDLDYRRKMGA